MRGQLSLELFFAFALFAIVVTWLSNYYYLFESNSIANVRQQELMVAERMVNAANLACLNHINVSVELPCIMRDEKQSAVYQIDSNITSFNITVPLMGNASTVYSRNALCGLSSGPILIICNASIDGRAQKLCIGSTSNPLVIDRVVNGC